MADIQVSCPACGQEARLGNQAVVLHESGERPFYAFTCPNCGTSVDKVADDKVIGLLKSAGARLHEDPVYPEEIQHPELPAITWDDLIDFHTQLDAIPTHYR